MRRTLALYFANRIHPPGGLALYSAAVLHNLLGQTVDSQLPLLLVSTDRICQRWASSIGTGLALEYHDPPDISPPPPLDHPTAIVVDRILLKSPPEIYWFVRRWYKSPKSARSISKEFGLQPREVYGVWRGNLRYLKVCFETSPHLPLRKLVASR